MRWKEDTTAGSRMSTGRSAYGIRTTTSSKRHNLVDMQFIYIKISHNIHVAEGMIKQCHKIICLFG